MFLLVCLFHPLNDPGDAGDLLCDEGRTLGWVGGAVFCCHRVAIQRSSPIRFGSRFSGYRNHMQRCFGADQGPGRLKRRTIHKQSLLRTIRTLLHPGLGRVCAFSLVCSAILLQTDGNGADGLDGRVKAVAVYPTRCFLQVRSILTHPGEIPEDPKWEHLGQVVVGEGKWPDMGQPRS